MSLQPNSRRAFVAIALAALASLPACSSMPVSSMVKLARTDFAAADPAALRIAVRLPQGLRPRPRGVTLKIAVAVDETKQEQTLVLTELDDPAELLSLSGELTRNTAIYAFRIDPVDLPQIAALREQMAAHKARGKRGSLSLGVGAEACRIGPLPASPLLTTYLKTERGGDFYPLVRDVDLRKELPGAVTPERIPPCP
ncbi:hypothetical protein HUU61_24070 [Rhodopseudomonas palustris]|nr:hypothetical protein [Rhodopseudomonas palustris]